MSRVSYAMLHADGAREMTRAVRAALAKLVAGLAATAASAPREILEVTLVGNPIMHHLVLGIDPVPLGSAPFALATDGAVRTRPPRSASARIPGARLYVLPCIAGHVGADTAGVILAEEPQRRREGIHLIVDVGHERRDRPGERRAPARGVQPDRPRVRGRPDQRRPARRPGCDRARAHRPRDTGAALQGDRRRRLVGRARVRRVASQPPGPASPGICGCGIVEVIAELFLAGGIASDGTIDGAAAARSSRIVPDAPDVLLRPLRAAGRVLPASGSASPRTTSGRSSSRRPRSTPASACSWTSSAWSRSTRSGSPARSAARSTSSTRWCSASSRTATCATSRRPAMPPASVPSSRCSPATPGREIETVVRRVQKVETAVEPRFQEHFVDAMALPHRTAAGHQPLAGRRPAGAVGAGPARSGAPARRARPSVVAVEEAATMTIETPQRRSRRPGRPPRRSGRTRSSSHEPFLTRAIAPYEVLGEEGLALLEWNADTILQEVGIDFRDDPDCARDAEGGRRRRRRRAGPLPARAVPPDHPGDRAARLDPVRAQPGAERHPRRPAHGPRAELRLALRHGPRPRPALRHDRGLPQLREADLRVALAASQRRHGLRARRPAREQAALRHGLFAHPLVGQAVHGLRDAAEPRAGQRGHGADRVQRASARTSSRRIR